MPLSDPAPRDPIHTRTVTCRGYRRQDGLWDIDGHMTDVKTYSFENKWRGEITPGVPLHEMWMRITVDDRLVIHAAEAVTDHAPFEPCAAIAPAFTQLKGLRIASGFTAKVKELFGGVQGCTHLVELLGPMATTAFQTIVPLVHEKRLEPKPDSDLTGPASPRKPPTLLNSCHGFSSAGEVVRRSWPEFYTGSQTSDPL